MPNFILKLNWFAKNAYVSMRRDLRYSLLAVVAIAFSVLSILAMGALANSLISVVNQNLVQARGGEVQITKSGGFTAADIAEIQKISEEGWFTRFTPVVDLNYSYLKQGNSGVHFAYFVYGIDPSTYPTLGAFRLRSGNDLSSLTLGANDAVISTDVATQLGVGIGDKFVLVVAGTYLPVELSVKDVITHNTAKQGSMVLLSTETAMRLKGKDTYSYVMVAGVQKPSSELVTKLAAAGYDSIVFSEEDRAAAQSIRDLFNFMLNGAGIVALFVGGIGIINTTRVMMGKRIKEIAVFKTLGYKQGELVIMYMLELLAIGILGSIVGTVVGIIVANYLVSVLANFGTILVETELTSELLLEAAATGVVGTLAFGLISVISATAQRPMDVFREARMPRKRLLKVGLVYVFVGAVLSLVAGLILNSLSSGIIAILAAVGAMIIFNLILRIVLFLITRLPIPLPASLALGKINLKRNIGKIVFPFLALFIGVTTIGLVMSVTESMDMRFVEKTPEREGQNVMSFADSRLASELEQFYDAEATNVVISRQINVELINPANGWNSDPMELAGRSREAANIDVEFTGAPFGTVLNGVYLPFYYQEDVQGDIELIRSDGTRFTVTVVGYYKLGESAQFLDSVPTGIITDTTTFDLIAGGSTGSVILVGEVSDQRAFANKVDQKYGTAVFTITQQDNDEVFLAILRNFSKLAIGVASLALVAAVVLIINIVSLALMERRKDIAVLKSVGYSQGQVQAIVLLEFGFIGLLVGLTSIVLIPTILKIINDAEPIAKLAISSKSLALLALIGALLPIITVLVTSWRDLRVKPLTILREE